MLIDDYYIVVSDDKKSVAGIVFSPPYGGFVLISPKIQSPFPFPTKESAIKAAQHYQKRHNIALQIRQCFVITHKIAQIDAVPDVPVLPNYHGL